LASGEGDPFRQVIFIVSFIIVVGLAFILRGQAILRAFPIPLVIVLLWCLLSVTWAIAPGIALRRSMLTIILIASVLAGVETLGPQRTLQSLKFVLATVLIVSCISIFIIPQAVHLPDELESELAGNWRGLHHHKNVAGPISALTALLFFHSALATRRWRDWLLFIAAVVFMIGAQSKTAIGFFGVSFVISVVYRFMSRSKGGARLFRFIFIALLVMSTVAWLAAYDVIAELMSDPTSLTGRVAIWQTAFDYLQDHWLLGAGFGSFWQVGEVSPALAVASQKWIQLTPHSHNGYIEILVTTGVFGLLLAVIAFVVIPIKQVLDLGHRNNEFKPLLLALFCFIIFSNLLETVFLNRDSPEWMMFLIALAIMHRLDREKAAGTAISPDRETSWPLSSSH
jgi:exopolysaccharide production protein ExoQ